MRFQSPHEGTLDLGFASMNYEMFGDNIEPIYRICGDPYRFFITGTGTTGDQYLIVLQEPYFIVVRFDKEGNLLGSFAKEMAGLDRADNSAAEMNESFASATDPALFEFLWSVGFTTGTIATKRFFLNEYSIGILDFPKAFTEYLASPSSFSSDEIVIAQAEQSRWRKERLYELWLDAQTNFWMKATGERESS